MMISSAFLIRVSTSAIHGGRLPWIATALPYKSMRNAGNYWLHVAPRKRAAFNTVSVMRTQPQGLISVNSEVREYYYYVLTLALMKKPEGLGAESLDT